MVKEIKDPIDTIGQDRTKFNFNLCVEHNYVFVKFRENRLDRSRVMAK